MELNTNRKMNKIIIILVVNLIFITNAFAQKETFQNEYGLGVGILGYTGRYSVNADFASKSSYNLNAFYQKNIINNNVWLRVNGVFGQLKGDNTSFENSGAAAGSFSTNIAEMNVLAVLDVFNLQTKKITPYLGVGIGGYTLLGYKASTGAAKTSKDKMGFIVPVIGGVKYKVSDNVKVFLEADARLLNKNLDNIVGAGISNPNRFYSVNIGAVISLKHKNAKPIW